MPSFVINNLTAPDIAPTDASTRIHLPICDHINLDVYNSAIYWSVAEAQAPFGQEQVWDWTDYVFMGPGSRTIYNRGAGIVGFRFYAAVLAANLPVGQLQAQVTAEIVQ